MNEKVRKGVIPKKGWGKFNAQESVRAYVRHLREQLKDQLGCGESLTQARTELARSQKEKLDAEREILERRWIPVEDAAEVVGIALDHVQKQIESSELSQEAQSLLIDKLQSLKWT